MKKIHNKSKLNIDKLSSSQIQYKTHFVSRIIHHIFMLFWKLNILCIRAFQFSSYWCTGADFSSTQEEPFIMSIKKGLLNYYRLLRNYFLMFMCMHRAIRKYGDGVQDRISGGKIVNHFFFPLQHCRTYRKIDFCQCWWRCFRLYIGRSVFQSYKFINQNSHSHQNCVRYCW